MNSNPITSLAAFVSVPSGLLDTCFVLLMVLGAYVCVSIVRRPLPKEGKPSEIDLFGSKFVLKGPAWLIMFGIGAIMIATPVLVAVAQRAAALDNAPPAPALAAQSIKDPDFTSFEFSQDIGELDLRATLSQPWYTRLFGWIGITGKHARVRPAVLTNYMTIRKVAPADSIHITYATSGTLDLRCLTHSCVAHIAPGEGDTRTGELVADVREIPVGAAFLLVTEVTYWNAFSDADTEDFTTYAHNQRNVPENVAMVIKFPEQKLPRNVVVEEQPPGDHSKRSFSGLAQRRGGASNSSFYWQTTTRGGAWYYTFTWPW
jgi:hypothetical protein